MRKQNAVYLAVLAAGLMVASRALPGSLDPTNAPGSTMHTLEEIYQKQIETYQKVQSLDPDTLQTLSAATPLLNAGYYAATNLTQVDTDLTPANIATNVTIFGVVGTLRTNAGGGTYSAALPKTGQTTSYAANDDGAYQKGVALPTPRFTVQADTNCILDNLTGLIWARNANMGGAMTWSAAITYCEALNYGGQTDWRLPNDRELKSLTHNGYYSPALCNSAGTGKWSANDPFTGVMSADNWETGYWSSSSYEASVDYAWSVHMHYGSVFRNHKPTTIYVWPVRGGQ